MCTYHSWPTVARVASMSGGKEGEKAIWAMM